MKCPSAAFEKEKSEKQHQEERSEQRSEEEK